MIKLIAMYLPQFHEIEENNEWWGKGHTEWTNCKKAIPYHKEHYQPKIPLNEEYYNLLDEEFQEKQNKLANEYGIYGFCYYHYWFEGKLLLEKPMENMLKNKHIHNKFCISWANHSWINKYEKKNRKLLIEQTYGDKKDWIKHFNYLLPFFKDERYIKVNNKPMLVIYDAKSIECWKEMKSVWDDLAKQNGLPGIYYVNTLKIYKDINETNKGEFDAQFEYQPALSTSPSNKFFSYQTFYNIKRVLYRDYLNKPARFNYDTVWSKILKNSYSNAKTYLGVFVDWDVTSRWGTRGLYYYGGTPEKFSYYLNKQIDKAKLNGSDYIFITAWNEWSEGAYLEPDEKYKYRYLESIKKLLSKGTSNE